MQNSTKNPPWARSNNVNSNMSGGMNPQIMDPGAMGMGQQGMMPFQQPYNANMMQPQAGMAMGMGGQMQMNQMSQGQMYPGNVVAYPTPRAMNAGMYSNNQSNQSQPSNNEQRVFTGTVTRTHNDFGFVDHDVFYQTSVCAKGVIPKVNDRVLVEATFNPNMPFKWNATRVQVLPKGGPTGPGGNKNMVGKSNTYNAVPPPANKKLPSRGRDDRPPRREDRKRSRSRSRSRSRDRRESRDRRRDSPARKRPVVHQPSPPKYVVRMPRMPLDISSLDVPSLSQRYSNLYVPSDFFTAKVRWGETFPPQNPFSLNNSCSYHIMSKEVENPVANDATLEPSDADYRFYAKVMLISLPTLETFYQKCGLTKAEEKEKDSKDKRSSSSKNPQHPTRLIKFLVGQKGKTSENFAIGGPWSPSLDGEDPQTDPTVLVRTAIRTCKALTGVDLSTCTQWYRMVEFYYWRESSAGKGRLETVVLFLPDVWSAEPPRPLWTDILEQYKAASDAALKRLESADPAEPSAEPSAEPTAEPPAEPQATDASLIENAGDESTITIEEGDDDEEKPEPTHYSKLDMKTIKVDQLRQELRARKVSCKGLRPALLSRLSKLLKVEEEKENQPDDATVVEVHSDAEAKPDEKSSDDKKEMENNKDTEDKKETDEGKDNEQKETKKEDEKKEKVEKPKTEKEIQEEKKKLEKQKSQLKSRYELPSSPHIIVHPSPTAKGGKFNCSVVSLSLLLDYRITDNKEHSFELFVFAELFNEMIMRDFGFYIYKTLYTLPEKPEPVKEEEKKEDKTEKKEEKDGKKEDGKKEDKRESRKRRDSHSEDERSSSPRGHRSRGVELPPDPYLLLSLIYFDTGRCHYISKKDMQTLFMSLGLQLSRSQIKSLLEKVCTNNFNYKSLAQSIKDLSCGTGEALQNLPLDSALPELDLPPVVAELEAQIASGNRNLLPVFERRDAGRAADQGPVAEVPEGGMVLFSSRLVDVGATLAALARSEAARGKLEQALGEARAVARSMRAAAAQTQALERSSLSRLDQLTEQLNAARSRVVSLTASSKIFHSALKSIQSKVEAVVNIKFEDEDVVEVVNGPAKVEKTEAKDEVKDESTDSKDIPTTEADKKEKLSTDKAGKDITDTENMDIDDKE